MAGQKLPLRSVAVRRIRFERLVPGWAAWTFGLAANAVFLVNTLLWPRRRGGGRGR